ncbi:Uncharacterised protein [Escherichia coli]|uniref:Uncharacterized protein n=1 Tax=Escherichia coli TaxID=562 RepID=A0A377BD86_ECOLX|nr:Uncharacterised protein [Escherichia coli]
MCGRSVAFWAVEKRAFAGRGWGQSLRGGVRERAVVAQVGFCVVGVSPWSGGARPAIGVLSPLYPGAVAFPLSRNRMKYM